MNQNKNNKNYITICFNQLFRPTQPYNLENVGDCIRCIHDKHNKNCALYEPVRLFIFEVEDNE